MSSIDSLMPFLNALREVALDVEAYGAGDPDQRFSVHISNEVAKAEKLAVRRDSGRVIPFRASLADVQSIPRLFKVSAPLEDELLQGWLGRIRSLNCLNSQKAAIALLQKMAREQDASSDSHADLIHCAASVLHASYEHILNEHTLAPFFLSLKDLKTSKLGTKSPRHKQARERQVRIQLPNKAPCYCAQCVREDIANTGYSYWRRQHQLPGMLWCQKHGDQLMIARSMQAFDHCPHEVMNSYVDPRVSGCSDEQRSILDKYCRMVSEVLAQAPVIDSAAASEVLGNRARMAHLRISKVGTRKTVSRRLHEVFPLWWLEEVFSRVHWGKNEFISTIDGICSPKATRYTASSLSLVAALLYDRVEEAVADLMAPQRAPRRDLGFNFWASSEMLEAYVTHRGVVSRIAERFSVSPTTAKAGLMKQGLPSFGKGGTEMAAAHMFLHGMPFAQACERYDVSAERLEAILRIGGSRLKAALDEMLQSTWNEFVALEGQHQAIG